MTQNPFPTIDVEATGANILRLRRERGLTVRDLQKYFGFPEPQAIYKWQQGKSLPSVDNLFALSVLLRIPMNDILVPSGAAASENMKKSEAAPSASSVLFTVPAA